MALSNEVYQALEDIVGPENISDDPAICDTYMYPLTHTAIHIGPWYGVSTPRPAAAVLPGNTEEVQAIIKVCNRYKVKYKAFSTGWSAMGYVSDDDAIQIDLRRMDKVLEIDERNQFAIVEPYVIGANLQAEAMKVGLNAHMIGAGASCSPLVAATSYLGPGPDTVFMGSGIENLLVFEWVMPDGEILRTGSLGSGGGWFGGEGPGPGIIGLIRGVIGTRGAMGIFTKCAIRLHPWPGPPNLTNEGVIPAYKAALPGNIVAHTVCWPSWEAYAEGCYKIWNAEIGYIAHRQYNMFGRDLKGAMIRILTDPTKTLSDIEELLKDPEVKRQTEEMTCDFELVLAGMTARDIEWQEKALDQILADTGGWKASLMEEPGVKDWSLLYMLRLGHKNLNLVYGGGYDGAFAMSGTPDFATPKMEVVADFKRKWEQEKTSIVLSGGDSMMGGVGGQGGGGLTGIPELFTHFDPYDKESVEGACEFFDATFKMGLEKGWGAGMERLNAVCRGSDGYAVSKEEHERMLSAGGPLVFNYQWKFKEAFNPNDLGDRYYLTVEVK